ncbi:MAG: serine hydrolase [Propionibacteriaceae bacterium]|jgi:CubicO group peptidase (beta-lactamase class C family)|nr:serine hydrolase [Propionibacteriaceae bacterium]
MERDRFDRAVELLESLTDQGGQPLKVFSLVVSEPGRVRSHDFGHDPHTTHNIRSISKVVTALTVDLARAAGLRAGGHLIGPDLPVWEALRDFGLVDDRVDPRWKEVRLWHLLSGTTGHQEGFFFRGDIAGLDPADYFPYIFDRPLEHLPGQHFSYSNVGTFLASVILQEASGRSVGQWAEQGFLSPIGVTGQDWAKLGPYDAGCTGLRLTGADLNRLGRLVLDEGSWQGRPLISADWIRRMRQPVVPTTDLYDPNDPIPRQAYGLTLWRTGGEIYYCYGTDGQFMVIVPSRQRVIATLADQVDMLPVQRGLAPLLD